MPVKFASSKYRARKVFIAGQQFDSKREAKRWIDLKAMENSGVISDLKRQVEFELIPAYYEDDIIGPKGGKKRGKLIQRACKYIADFTYYKDGEYIVEDSKGFRTPEYMIKKKLMYDRFRIIVKET